MNVALHIARTAQADRALPLPAYATAGAAGMDICADLGGGTRTLPPGTRALIPTGLILMVPPGHEVQLRPRSGLALQQGITLLNSPGTIDSDYRGELGVIVVNHGTEPVTISHGQRICQMVLAPVVRAQVVAATTVEATARGDGGFGHTGH